MTRTNQKKVRDSGNEVRDSRDEVRDSGNGVRDLENNTIKFPPDGTYTGVLIAENFGIKESTLRDWYKELCEGIYQVCPEILKKGQLYTQTAYDEFFLMRQHRYKNRMVINSRGQIVRHNDGQPVVESCQRMSKTNYQTMRWEQKPELVPVTAEDSLDNHIEEKGGVVTAEIVQTYDAEFVAQNNSALERIDDIALQNQQWLAGLDQIGFDMAEAATARVAEALSKRLSENMTTLQENVVKAISPRSSS